MRDASRAPRRRDGRLAGSGSTRCARYLQDVAADDVDDAGVEGAWVMRRMALRIDRPLDVPRRDRAAHVLQRHRRARRRATYDRPPRRRRRRWRRSRSGCTSTSGPSRAARGLVLRPLRRTAAGRRVNGRLRHRPPPADRGRAAMAVARDRLRRPRAREQRGVVGRGRGRARPGGTRTDAGGGRDRVPGRGRPRRIRRAAEHVDRRPVGLLAHRGRRRARPRPWCGSTAEVVGVDADAHPLRLRISGTVAGPSGQRDVVAS